jgi:L-seryl-tRNA(Ser) seleniumtransferase
LKRALRLDKGRIAALEAVLRLYLDPERLVERLPTLRLLCRPKQALLELAARLQPLVQSYCGTLAQVSVAPCASQVGSGSLPVERLESAALRLVPTAENPGAAAAGIARALRALPVPVIGRVHDGAVWLDLRCLEDEQGFCAQLRGKSLPA